MAAETLLSAGIDIGTSTTQLIFSQFTLVNRASDYAVPRIEIEDKKIIYKSRIYFTPLKSQREIDGEALVKIIEGEYARAGIRPSEVKTGAVIITGETARKENAQMLVQKFSELAGDFVVAAAGPDLEGILAAKGAGADVYSKEHRLLTLNIDIGGGTSNFALIKNGSPYDTGCLDIGGRLVKFDGEEKIIYIAKKVKTLIERHKLSLFEGMKPCAEEIFKLTDIFCRILEMGAGLFPADEDYALMVTNHGLNCIENMKTPIEIEAVSFSGGVAEYIYGDKVPEDFYQYGDIGLFLAMSLRKSAFVSSNKKIRLFEGVEKIRATVVGAGSHTTRLSGSTISADENCLPLKNIPVAKIESDEEFDADGAVHAGKIIRAVEKKLGWFDGETAAIGLTGLLSPSFSSIEVYAGAVLEGFLKVRTKEDLLIVIVENDMAKVLGQTLQRLSGNHPKILCLDGISLTCGDYIDIGRPAVFGQVVPIVVKTLVFHE